MPGIYMNSAIHSEVANRTELIFFSFFFSFQVQLSFRTAEAPIGKHHVLAHISKFIGRQLLHREEIGILQFLGKLVPPAIPDSSLLSVY